jgi:hypothetical protein
VGGGGMGGGMGGMGGGMGMMGGRMASMTAADTSDMSSPRTKIVLDKLDRPIAMNFPKSTRLRNILKYLSDHTKTPNEPGIPIYVDPVGVEDIETVLDLPITIDLDDIPLNDMLELLLEQAGLAHCVKDGLLIVSTPWRVSTEKAASEAASSDDSPESRAVLERLDNPAPIKFPKKTPLHDILNYVTIYTKSPGATSIPIYFDPPDSAEVGRAKTLTLGMEVEAIPLRTTLRLLLAQVGLEFSVKNGILIINKPRSMGGMMGGMSGMGGMMGGMSRMGGVKPEPDAEGNATKLKQSTKKGKKTASRGGH